MQIQCPVALIDHNLEQQPPEVRYRPACTLYSFSSPPTQLPSTRTIFTAPQVRKAATDFVNYLYTPSAQREFAACGFR